MEKTESPQLELFSEGKTPEIVKRSFQDSLLGHVRNYEKTILLIICLVICSVISFSIGVEKGKRSALLVNSARLINQPIKETYQPVIKKQIEQPLINNRENTALPAAMVNRSNAPVTVAGQTQNYTIQLASYKNRVSANKEAEVLKRKGLVPLILPKGSYSIVCVGNFADKDTAKQLLTELKKRYQDSFIRRL